jgi:hypothetical protein
MLAFDASWLPSLSAEVQAFIRVAYGVLQLLTIVSALPHAARYFRSERWGGYAQSSVSVDAVQNPVVGVAVMVVWLCSAVGLVIGRFVVAAAFANLAISYYLFIRMRWRGVLRGMGAPGFMSFWLGAAVFLLELTSRDAPAARPVALLMLQVDFAFIMLSAGVYKLVAGYADGDGMDLGMVNPEWGYWPRFWSRRRTDHPVFRLLNQMAWTTEVVAGAAMLFPPTRPVGALAILLSFVFIATQIRLGFLCEMVIVSGLLFFGPGTWGDRSITAALPFIGTTAGVGGAPLPSVVQTTLAAFCWTYLALLPIARVAMYYNQLAHRALPPRVQQPLDVYTNAVGLIIWRVFTADVVNFVIRIWEQYASGDRRLLSDYEGFPGVRRFRQVAECITITSVFTTLKYYPSNRALFDERLLRYARTIPCAPTSRLVFEWVDIVKQATRFEFVTAAEFAVDVRRGAIDERIVADAATLRSAASGSPVHEGIRPGSYAPARR